MTNRRRFVQVRTIATACGVGLFGLVAWNHRGELAAIVGRRPDPRLFVLAFLAAQAGLLTTFLRWFVLVRVVEPRLTLRSCVVLGFLGHAFNLLIPGAVGGDLVRAAYLGTMDVKRTQVIASMAIDRVAGLVGLLLLAAVGGIVQWSNTGNELRLLFLFVGGMLGLGLASLAVGLAMRGSPRRVAGMPTIPARLALGLAELRLMLGAYRRRPGVWPTVLGLSMLSHAASVVAFYLMGQMLSPGEMDSSLAEHFLIVPMILLTTAVPLPFGALGLSEEVGELLFRIAGHEGGALAMIGLRVLMLINALEGAFIYLASRCHLRTRNDSSPLSPVKGDASPTMPGTPRPLPPLPAEATC